MSGTNSNKTKGLAEQAQAKAQVETVHTGRVPKPLPVREYAEHASGSTPVSLAERIREAQAKAKEARKDSPDDDFVIHPEDCMEEEESPSTEEGGLSYHEQV